MSDTKTPSGPAIAAPGGRNARLANLWHTGTFPWHAAFTAATVSFVFTLPDQRLYTVQNMCIYIHTHTVYDCLHVIMHMGN
jgi:hypothetical protein